MTREMSRRHRHHSLHHPRHHHGHDSKNNTHNKSSSSLLIEKAFFFHILVFCSMFEATVTGSVGADTGLEVGGAVSKRDPRSRGRTSAPATVGTTTAAATPAPYPTSTMNENYRNGAGGCKDNAPTSVCSTVSPEECVGQGWGVQVSPCPPARPPARTQTAHIICIFLFYFFKKKISGYQLPSRSHFYTACLYYSTFSSLCDRTHAVRLCSSGGHVAACTLNSVYDMPC